MRVFILIFLIALALTTFGARLVRRLALFIGFVDLPDPRKVHREPIPLMGGVAIVAGALTAFLLLGFLLPVSFTSRTVVGIFLAAIVIVTVGLIDDRRNLPAWVKLLGQTIAAAILVYFGVQVRLALPSWLNLLVTFVWLVGISNAFNFLDNMDGLTAGVSAVASAFILLLAVTNEQHLVAALAAGILGACLGFLRLNFTPATIFMGDAGSLFLGFMLAVLGIQLRFPDNVNFVTWMVPVLILGLPILDTALVIVSRTRLRVNPLTTAGKDHISHRIVRLGYSQREAVLILYLIAGIFGMVALFITSADVLEGYATGIAAVIISLYAIWRFEKIETH